MTKGSLDKYILPDHKKELVQVHLDASTKARIEKYKAKKGISWSRLVSALLARLIDEEKL